MNYKEKLKLFDIPIGEASSQNIMNIDTNSTYDNIITISLFFIIIFFTTFCGIKGPPAFFIQEISFKGPQIKLNDYAFTLYNPTYISLYLHLFFKNNLPSNYRKLLNLSYDFIMQKEGNIIHRHNGSIKEHNIKQEEIFLFHDFPVDYDQFKIANIESSKYKNLISGKFILKRGNY